jgi:hypothetical protein
MLGDPRTFAMLCLGRDLAPSWPRPINQYNYMAVRISLTESLRGAGIWDEILAAARQYESRTHRPADPVADALVLLTHAPSLLEAIDKQVATLEALRTELSAPALQVVDASYHCPHLAGRATS